MVYYRDAALIDLINLFDGLVNWQTENGQKHLDYEMALSYFNDVKNAFDSIDTRFYHSKAKYPTHKQFGKYTYQYKRNARTSWYACYDIIDSDIVITRIISNYYTLGNVQK